MLLGMDGAVLSLTVETDGEALIRRLGGGPLPSRRLMTASRTVHAGMTGQITVSPCLPYSDAFTSRLIDTGVTRFVVDTVVDGMGTAPAAPGLPAAGMGGNLNGTAATIRWC
ncbi:MAG: hypothetical protein ACP5QO_13225 [Clostridia bacterium]